MRPRVPALENGGLVEPSRRVHGTKHHTAPALEVPKVEDVHLNPVAELSGRYR